MLRNNLPSKVNEHLVLCTLKSTFFHLIFSVKRFAIQTCMKIIWVCLINELSKFFSKKFASKFILFILHLIKRLNISTFHNHSYHSLTETIQIYLQLHNLGQILRNKVDALLLKTFHFEIVWWNENWDNILDCELRRI